MKTQQEALKEKLKWYLKETSLGGVLNDLIDTNAQHFLAFIEQREIPKRYDDDFLNTIFRYEEKENLTEEHWYFMSIIKYKLLEAHEQYITISLKKSDYQEIQPTGLKKVLDLLLPNYHYDVTLYPEAKDYEDVVVITIQWSHNIEQ